MTREDFLENTLDVWEIPAESATRVGHPAPFPVELPSRLIELYTYRGRPGPGSLRRRGRDRGGSRAVRTLLRGL